MFRQRMHIIRFAVLFTTLFIFFIKPAFAETVTFTKEYTYQASELDSKASCRTIALEQVKRLLLEELGTYMEGQSEVKNLQMSKDKITALTAGVVQAEIIDEKWDGTKYWVKAVLKADPDDVAKSIDSMRSDTKKTADLENMKKKQDEALSEIERLKSEIVSLQNDMKAQERFNKSIEILKSQETESQTISPPADNQVTYVKPIVPVYPPKRKKTKKTVVATETPKEYKYVGSVKSKKYHYLTCKWAQKISPANRVYFKSAKEAREAGYVPCKICKPPLAD